ncbi:MAG: hypothetical protein HOK05_03580 [Nitrosopumilus sp.]|jgi:hypothetical protein|nr:hypothetical protein [Nitrosopumilus sp.]
MDNKSFGIGIGVGIVIAILLVAILGVLLIEMYPYQNIEEVCFDNSLTDSAYQECLRNLRD